MSVFVPEKRVQAMSLSLLLAQKVREYFTDEAHRREFEEDYKARHGKDYVWPEVTKK